MYIQFRAIRLYKDNRTLHAKSPFSIGIVDNTEGFPISTASNEYGIVAQGGTISEIEAEIIEQVFFVWDSYALDDTSPMTKGAIELKALLLRQFKENKS